MAPRPERLGWSEYTENAMLACLSPLLWLCAVQLWLSDAHAGRSRKRRQPLLPHVLAVRSFGLHPLGAEQELWRYGIDTVCVGSCWRIADQRKFAGGCWRTIEQRKCRDHYIAVPRRRAWEADRHLRAAGWLMLNAPVGDSDLSARSGRWRAWSNGGRSTVRHRTLYSWVMGLVYG